MKIRPFYHALWIVAIALLIWLPSSLFAAPLAGAIFTTTPDGGIVNENVHYASKLEVYLDGGPGNNAPQDAAGLPDGLYVFQVTNPSGFVLLSEDPSKCRIVRVADGIIVELVAPSALPNPYGPLTDDYYVGNGHGHGKNSNGSSIPCHIQDDPEGVAGVSGHHDTNEDTDHGPEAIVVQLMPYLDTPNPGGVYKAWVRPIARYVDDSSLGNLEVIPKDRGYVKKKGQKLGYKPDPGFGPPRDESKTDNYKVKERIPPGELHVRKFHDLNGNGVFDTGTEPEIGVDQCVDANGLIVDCTSGGGWEVCFEENPPGDLHNQCRFTPVWEDIANGISVRVTETLYSGWIQSHLSITTNGNTSILTVNVQTPFIPFNSGDDIEVLYGNFMPGEIHGRKVIDLDGDGVIDQEDICPIVDDVQDPNYDGCVGVQVNLTGTDGQGNGVNRNTTTDTDGNFWFMNVDPGTYSVSIVDPTGFFCSFPNPCVYNNIVIESSDVVTDINFADFAPVDIHAEKFSDLNVSGTKDQGEPPVSNVEICLEDGGDNPVAADDFVPGATVVAACQFTNANGLVWWMDLKPGTYTAVETVPPFNFATTLVIQSITLASAGMHTFLFGNFGPCDGLSPGYWKNWRNHYTTQQMEILIAGTIAPTIAEVDAIFEHWDNSPGDEITRLRAFLLANQLTINLTQHPELPNPSGGLLHGSCTLPIIGDLQAVIDAALAIHNNPGGFSREEISAVANALEAFWTLFP